MLNHTKFHFIFKNAAQLKVLLSTARSNRTSLHAESTTKVQGRKQTTDFHLLQLWADPSTPNETSLSRKLPKRSRVPINWKKAFLTVIRLQEQLDMRKKNLNHNFKTNQLLPRQICPKECQDEVNISRIYVNYLITHQVVCTVQSSTLLEGNITVLFPSIKNLFGY